MFVRRRHDRLTVDHEEAVDQRNQRRLGRFGKTPDGFVDVRWRDDGRGGHGHP